MNKTPVYKAVLFDIGGVLVELTGIPRMMELTGHRYSVAELWKRWITSPAIRAFESGQMPIYEFGNAVTTEFGITIPAAQYLNEFASWPAGPFPGVHTLLATLKKRIRIASLSNTNILHWNRVVNDMDFIHYFEMNFPSHETGHLKPDSATFRYCASHMGLQPEDILFLDDNELNIAGARKTGMAAALVLGIDGVKTELTAQGLLP